MLELDRVLGTRIYLGSLEIEVYVGDLISIRLASEAVLPELLGVKCSVSDPYPHGALWIDDSALREDQDMAFKTWVNTLIFNDGFESGNTSSWSATEP